MTNEIINFGGKCFSVLSVSGISVSITVAARSFSHCFNHVLHERDCVRVHDAWCTGLLRHRVHSGSPVCRH